jgi:exportin-T
MTPEEVERYVLLASDASNLQNQQQANAFLNHWVSTTDDRVLADALVPVLRTSQQEVVLFFVLTAFLNLRTTTQEQRVRMRQDLFTLLVHDTTGCWSPTYLRTKVGVLLASLIQLDFPTGNWPSAFDELQSFELLQGAPDILLRTLVALMDDFGHNETSVNATIKDMLRGYATQNGNVDSSQQQGASTPLIAPAQSMSAQLLKTIFSLLGQALEVCNGAVPPQQLQICVLALTALKGFMAWIDLSLVLEEQQVLNLIFTSLAKGSTTDSPMADAGVMAVECLQELIARGMEEEKKVAILVHTNVLETIHAHVNLETVDASPIDVVLEVARFIDRTGLEVMSVMLGGTGSASGTLTADHAKVRSQLLDLFFRCFAYDDIDVSGAVIPLAGSLIPAQDKQRQGQQPVCPSDPVLSQLLTVTFRQMRYPEDFQFDYEDEDEAEEEMYRTELRNLNLKFIRAAPEAFLQFICQTLAQLPLPLSIAPTPDIEAALRLVYHYCEGIRPPPGMKIVMKDETFRSLLVAIHTSDITLHPHREVLTLYYETAVRYYPLLKERPDLLKIVLESLSGNRGLQHEHSRVRSRCCYMLLRLVKSVGNNSNSSGPNPLRPYVETAVSGIQSLLENDAVQLRSDDTLNLFETIGLLLGKTGVEPSEQKRYLTQVMTPHIRSIEQVLKHKEAVVQDPETYGEMLSSSVAAIAFLSKGFKRPSEPVQEVLLETLHFVMTVLETLPNVDAVRNKSMVLLQRLIQCLEDKVLPIVPRFLHLVILHCNTEDILDVSQLYNQLCIKFNEKSIPAIDAALIPFLQKCHVLANSGTAGATAPDYSGFVAPSMTAPHQRTEQLSIQKLSYMVLNHIVVNKATGVLYTPTHLSSLEGILQSMNEGATRVEDPAMKKTCLVFFKEVLEQWIVVGNDSKEANPAPATVVQGFVQFLCNILIPGVLESFAQPNFSVSDANQWRCVLEFAALLDLLREHAPQVYQQQVLVGILTTRLGCPPDLVENFRLAADHKAVETSLQTLLERQPAE